MVGSMSRSSILSRNCCVKLCSELFNKSRLWSIPNIISFFESFAILTNLCISPIKSVPVEFGGLYKLETNIFCPFFATISTLVDSNLLSLKVMLLVECLHVMPSLTSIAVPPPLCSFLESVKILAFVIIVGYFYLERFCISVLCLQGSFYSLIF